MKYYIGVDPGQKGGLALVKEGMAIEYEPMPGTVKGIKAWFEFINYRIFAERDKAVMVVELAQPMPKQGVVSVFTYGRHFGTFEALATAFDIPYHEVRPAVWKRAMGLNAAKADAISLCERLFPSVNLIFPRCRKAHDGVAEALLIAAFGGRANL